MNEKLMEKTREANSPEELSDDELDAVAGGMYARDGRMVVTVGYTCEHFLCKCGGTGGMSKVAFGKLFEIKLPLTCYNCGSRTNCKHCRNMSYEKGLWLCNAPQNRRS